MITQENYSEKLRETHFVFENSDGSTIYVDEMTEGFAVSIDEKFVKPFVTLADAKEYAKEILR